MLKWKGKEAHVWISDMCDHALQHDMSYNWTINWVKLLYKGGDVINANNYQNNHGLFINIFGCLMESKELHDLKKWHESLWTSWRSKTS